MTDLISRQAAIDALADMHCKSDEDGYVWIIRSDAWKRIDALPSTQPKTAGRCINCKYRYDGDCPMRFEEIVEIDDDGYIDHDVIYHDFTRDDGYCDRWERRTDE